MQLDRFAESEQFAEGKQVPIKLTARDVTALTKQDVLGIYEFGQRVVFVLENGMKLHIPKW